MSRVIAAIVSTAEGNEVGRVSIREDSSQFRLTPIVAIQGREGTQIAEILNEKGSLVLASAGYAVLVGSAWDIHVRRLELSRVVAAMSRGALRLIYDEKAWETLAQRQAEVNLAAAKLGRRSYAKLLAARMKKYQPVLASAVEKLVTDFEAKKPCDTGWLTTFSEAFVAVP